KGDGFYYSAMAFYHLGNEPKVQKYLEKAERKADGELKIKLQAFTDLMNAQERAQELEKDALAYQKNNNQRAAADAWKKAWEANKQRTDFALNAVENFLALDSYEEALEILRAPEVSVDPNAQALISSINQTPEMVAKEGYTSSMSQGQEAFDEGNYVLALEQFNKALYHNNSDQKALAMRKKTEEELAWSMAKESSFIGDTERYADAYPAGKYISQAKATMKSSYLSIAKDNFRNNNESGMVDIYNRFVSRFPGDNGIFQIKDLLLDYYYREGEEQFKADNYNNAKSFYQQYLKVSSTGSKQAECMARIKKCDRRLNQRGAGLLLYTYDAQSPIGLGFGRINRNGAGMYANLKINKEIFTGLDVLYEIDNAGNSDRPGSVQRTGEDREANICLSMGVTFKLAYPLWGYIGAGAGYYTVYQQADTYFSNGDFWEEDWLKNTDRTEVRFFPEAGLKLKIGNAFILKYGVMYQNEAIQQFGLGFAL
ncbi:MAG: tetratricopeptide (TPR) repeat protein, partial [Flavobacteriales bacterium]